MAYCAVVCQDRRREGGQQRNLNTQLPSFSLTMTFTGFDGTKEQFVFRCSSVSNSY